VAVTDLVEVPDPGSSARRVARNTFVRGVGEIVGKLATIALFIVMARKLGPEDFGVITFALALSGALLTIVGFGADLVLTREVARKPALLGSYMGNTLVLKAITTVPALLIAVAVVQFESYSGPQRLALYLVAASTAIDTLENTWNAAFTAHERLEFVSVAVVFQRLVTGGLVILILAAGRGVVAVSGSLVVVSVATILLAMWLLRFVASPTWTVERSRLMPLLRAGFPIALSVLLLTILLRVDMVLLGLIGSNRDVGIYGAAFRLFEATMFLSLSFSGAIFPWLSRKHIESRAAFARGYEIGLVVLLALLTPIGVGYLLFAEPITHLLYGSTYNGSITPLRLLGFVVITYGVNYLTNSALAAHDRPSLMHRILFVTVVVNIALNLILIPLYGPTGAAAAAAVSGLLLGALSIWQASRTLGRVRLVRLLIGPATGAAAMALAVIPVWNSLLPGILLGGAAYLAGLVLVERMFFPDDFSRLIGFVRVRPRSA